MKRIAVYCGSSSGGHEDYRAAAEAVGHHLAREGVELVYGGGNVGLMGVLADAVLRGGGRVTGVIPRGMMRKELGHLGVQELVVVETMHERKARMAELADGFLALPGGFGTLEELFEVLTWRQLGMHAKPVALLNVRGYYDPLLELLNRVVGERFMHPEYAEDLLVGTGIAELLGAMRAFRPTRVEKWME